MSAPVNPPHFPVIHRQFTGNDRIVPVVFLFLADFFQVQFEVPAVYNLPGCLVEGDVFDIRSTSAGSDFGNAPGPGRDSGLNYGLSGNWTSCRRRSRCGLAIQLLKGMKTEKGRKAAIAHIKIVATLEQ